MPKFSVDTAKIAFDLLDDTTWFFAPYSICLELRKREDCYISGLAVQTPSRDMYMITDTQMEKMKRREIILFKWRIIHYIRRERNGVYRHASSVSYGKSDRICFLKKI